LLTEFGVHLSAGATGVVPRLRQALDRAPVVLSVSLESVLEEIHDLELKLREIDRQLGQIAKHDPAAQRLMTIPGIGVITATALIGSVPDIHVFHRARQFSAWLGLTPREYSSGQSRRLGGISKRGDRYLRMLTPKVSHGCSAGCSTSNSALTTTKPLSRSPTSWSDCLVGLDPGRELSGSMMPTSPLQRIMSQPSSGAGTRTPNRRLQAVLVTTGKGRWTTTANAQEYL
jgi:hypothetical protein